MLLAEGQGLPARRGTPDSSLLPSTAPCFSRCKSSRPSVRPPARLAPMQLPALRWRPKLTSPHRRLFNLCHWYIGRVAVILAVSNIFYVRMGWARVHTCVARL